MSFNKMSFNDLIDRANIQTYSRHGLDNDSKIYSCCLCCKPVGLSDSYSNRGHMLVCLSCFSSAFNSKLDKLIEAAEIYSSKGE